MDVLFDSLHSAYSNDSDLSAALSGGLYRMEAVQNASFPYGTMHLIGIAPYNTFSEVGEVAQIQFNLFDKDILLCRPLRC